MKEPHVTHIALSGGGLCGVSYLGCIRFLETEHIMESIRHISGTSMGAFFGAAIALRIPYSELEDAIREFARSPLMFEATKLLHVMTTFGIDDGEFLVRPLRQYVQRVHGADDITFLELTKKTGRHFVVCATCVETMKPTYFSVDTTPDIGVLAAVQASMAVPVLVKPKKIGDFHYADGGVADNMPVAPFRAVSQQSMLALRVSSDNSEPPPNIMSSFATYISSLFYTYCTQTIKNDEHITWCVHLDKCPLSFMPVKFAKEGIEISIPEEKIDDSILYGYRKLQEWFSTITEPSVP